MNLGIFLLDYLTIFSFQETFSIPLCHSFVFLRMNSLRVKGGVREARHISEAMTRLLSPKEAICEMCEMPQIGNLEHLRKDGLFFPGSPNLVDCQDKPLTNLLNPY